MAEEQREKEIDWQKVQESFKFVRNLTERGIAISGAAQLDDWLEKLLREFFIDNEKACDALLGDPGPVSTFGARIDLAFALGLISINEHRMLNLIRKIRNDFSHSPAAPSFHASPIKERCLELDSAPKVLQLFVDRPLDPTNPEERFFAATSFLFAAITHRSEIPQRCQEPGSMTDEQLASLIQAATKASK
jgi:DNA-binding MltR family transcriptional regulator